MYEFVYEIVTLILPPFVLIFISIITWHYYFDSHFISDCRHHKTFMSRENAYIVDIIKIQTNDFNNSLIFCFWCFFCYQWIITRLLSKIKKTSLSSIVLSWISKQEFNYLIKIELMYEIYELLIIVKVLKLIISNG